MSKTKLQLHNLRQKLLMNLSAGKLLIARRRLKEAKKRLGYLGHWEWEKIVAEVRGGLGDYKQS